MQARPTRSLTGSLFLVAAGLFGAVGVAAGAFAAHGLAPLRGDRAAALWVTASNYQILHALALALCSRMVTEAGWARLAGGAFLVGSVLFPGALYVLGWYGPGPLGAVAPVGGLCYIVGWFCLVAHGVSRGGA